ncbi:MAG TPA: GLPGLI family protein [Mucilaginibacter sp.]
MSSKIYLSIFCFFTCTVYGQQKPDTAIAMITYSFSHMRDTTNPTKFYTENMDLFLGKASSLYKSGDKKLVDSLAMASFNASGHKSITVPRPYTFSQLFMYPGSQELFVFDRVMMDKYIMKDDWPQIDWKITDETKKISQLTCQKAIGTWRGRIYEAWFCPDLPFHAGPWKLNGLPGLIIEANDSHHQVMFKFAGYRTLGDSKIVITLPSKNQAKPATIQDFTKMRDAIKKNPSIIASASGGKMIPATGTSGHSANSFNNPLELSKP